MTAFSAADVRFMRRALALAKRGGPKVSPNPQVGCVLVRAGRIVAEGWHAVFGGPHAEARALALAGRRARGTTAYVNLEPCCHTDKKTPPCTRALIAARIRRVVVGMKDPNPRVRGKGILELRKAGIRVSAEILKEECSAFNRPFSVRMERNRPYVILKAAASLDGRICTAGGESKWITSRESREASRRMRAQVDAIVVGVNTVLRDDPRLTSHGRGRNPLRVVLDTKLRTPRSARVLDRRAPTLIATSRRDFGFSKNLGGASVLYLPPGAGGVDLRTLLKLLLNMGIGTILVEGGGRVHTAFLSAGLVDELRLFIAPKLIGGAGAPGFFGGVGIRRLRDSLKLEDVSVRRIGPDILITGRLN